MRFRQLRASLDTNAIIHFYKAGLQDILFVFFDEGVFIYEQIRKIELENHGQDVLFQVDIDIPGMKPRNIFLILTVDIF